MDVPSGFRQPNKKKGGSKSKGHAAPLFQDTSTPQPGGNVPPGGGYPGGQPPVSQAYGASPPAAPFPNYDQGNYGNQQEFQGMQQFAGQNLMSHPMANVAMGLGSSVAGQGKEYLDKHMQTSKLKYYFAVDTTYVAKKLILLLFPYSHKDWSLKYNQDEPVAPRYEVNAPDLYIPVMAFVTYILVAGLVLGTQNRFSPEQLGMLSSTASIWMVLELLVIMLAMYIMNVKTDLKYLDILSYSGYKFVGMIFCLIGGLVFQSLGYFIALAWCSAAIGFFLVRTLRVQIMPHSSEGYQRESKRCLYLILSIAGFQPVLIWWLCRTVLFF